MRTEAEIKQAQSTADDMRNRTANSVIQAYLEGWTDSLLFALED